MKLELLVVVSAAASGCNSDIHELSCDEMAYTLNTCGAGGKSSIKLED